MKNYDLDVNHIYSNKITREMIQKIFKQNDTMVAITESKINVVNYDFEYIESWIDTLMDSPEVMDKILLFSINGYDNDSRELYEIEEVRYYANGLLNKFPHFLMFFRPEAISWLLVCATLRILDSNVQVEDDTVKLAINKQKYKDIVMKAVDNSKSISYMNDEYRDNFVKVMLSQIV